MRAPFSTAVAIATLAIAARTVTADDVTLTVHLDATPAGGTYTLTGQSATLLTTLFGSSSGGQLDDVSTGETTIGYQEVFPPPAITDYQNFGYFGRINRFDSDPNIPDDTSMIVALQPGAGVGQTIDQIFPGPAEATLVAALAGDDSPEYFELLDAVLANPDSMGTVELPTVPRAGQTLDLVAFIGGPQGDLGVKVGDFAFSIVPEPASAFGLVLMGSFLARRGRR